MGSTGFVYCSMGLYRRFESYDCGDVRTKDAGTAAGAETCNFGAKLTPLAHCIAAQSKLISWFYLLGPLASGPQVHKYLILSPDLKLQRTPTLGEHPAPAWNKENEDGSWLGCLSAKAWVHEQSSCLKLMGVQVVLYVLGSARPNDSQKIRIVVLHIATHRAPHPITDCYRVGGVTDICSGCFYSHKPPPILQGRLRDALPPFVW